MIELLHLSHAHPIIARACCAETIRGWVLFHSAQVRELVWEQFKGEENSSKCGI